MATIVIQIGNSDDKLTQYKWAQFVEFVNDNIKALGWVVHFSGGSSADKFWQNYCWVCESDRCEARTFEQIHLQLSQAVKEFKQDSIALTIGNTEFIK